MMLLYADEEDEDSTGNECLALYIQLRNIVHINVTF